MDSLEREILKDKLIVHFVNLETTMTELLNELDNSIIPESEKVRLRDIQNMLKYEYSKLDDKFEQMIIEDIRGEDK